MYQPGEGGLGREDETVKNFLRQKFILKLGREEAYLFCSCVTVKTICRSVGKLKQSPVKI